MFLAGTDIKDSGLPAVVSVEEASEDKTIHFPTMLETRLSSIKQQGRDGGAGGAGGLRWLTALISRVSSCSASACS